MLANLKVDPELFHTADGTAFADLMIDGHRETWPIRGSRFRSWLRRPHYEATGEAPSAKAIWTRGAFGEDVMVGWRRSTNSQGSHSFHGPPCVHLATVAGRVVEKLVSEFRRRPRVDRRARTSLSWPSRRACAHQSEDEQDKENYNKDVEQHPSNIAGRF
jgi:hypothetical protein